MLHITNVPYIIDLCILVKILREVVFLKILLVFFILRDLKKFYTRKSEADAINYVRAAVQWRAPVARQTLALTRTV